MAGGSEDGLLVLGWDARSALGCLGESLSVLGDEAWCLVVLGWLGIVGERVSAGWFGAAAGFWPGGGG